MLKMGKERKKFKTPVNPIVTKTRVRPPNVEVKPKPKVDEVSSSNEALKTTDKYVKLYIDASDEVRKKIIDRANSGELKYVYYGADGNRGAYYYLVIKK